MTRHDTDCLCRPGVVKAAKKTAHRAPKAASDQYAFLNHGFAISLSNITASGGKLKDSKTSTEIIRFYVESRARRGKNAAATTTTTDCGALLKNHQRRSRAYFNSRRPYGYREGDMIYR
jgi:hypothetical protein